MCIVLLFLYMPHFLAILCSLIETSGWLMKIKSGKCSVNTNFNILVFILIYIKYDERKKSHYIMGLNKKSLQKNKYVMIYTMPNSKIIHKTLKQNGYS